MAEAESDDAVIGEHPTDTIAAIATGPTAGGIGIVRVSGPLAHAIALAVTGRALHARSAQHARFLDGDGAVLDDGIALLFPAPHSYTGEDVLELQAHGSPIVLQQLLSRCLELGARSARAGEFSERAFLNGKLDLAQAEAVADLIAADSEAAARAARRSLDGVFSARVQQLLESLTRLRVHIAAAIDFPEEEIDFLADHALMQRLDNTLAEHAGLLIEAERGQRLRDGLHVVIIGPPNAGKSSLLNALAGSDRAIVTEQAGTTRDLLREEIRVDGIGLTLVDTAGLRESLDAIEVEGIRRARSELDRADLVLAVLDAREADRQRADLTGEIRADQLVVWLYNKFDLLPTPQSVVPDAGGDAMWLSLRNGDGLDALRERLRRAAGHGPDQTGSAGGAFSARTRHVEALRRTGQHLRAAARQLRDDRAGELAAEELRLAQQTLGEITGTFGSDELLGAIFASFCIGK
ncbi:MAG: tRNA uridine-5-carboxymethylaminomethyl(34) synthesis GTPase MnmE [Lysobacteraceae bacterium]